MINIKVYRDISESNLWIEMPDAKVIFNAETVKDLFTKYKDENDFNFDINCNGGSVHEGFAIYDIMRRSGKNIFTNIDGVCHSMALIILLAAPKENRTANKHATALIHDVTCPVSEHLSATSALTLAEELMKQRNRILEVYAERTGSELKKLEAVMLEEREHSAEELKKLGFISKINNYINQKMSKLPLSTRITNFLGLTDKKNYVFTDPDGVALFETENETAEIAVGDAAVPDGTYELDDGRTVVIENGVITSIDEPSSLDSVIAENAELKTRLAEAEQLLKNAKIEIEKLEKLRSTANVANRNATGRRVTGGKNKPVTAEDIMREHLERIAKNKKS